MPALYLFNRRTLLAGDDLQLPSLAWGSVVSLELFVLIPYLSYFVIDLLLSTTTNSQNNISASGDSSISNSPWTTTASYHDNENSSSSSSSSLLYLSFLTNIMSNTVNNARRRQQQDLFQISYNNEEWTTNNSSSFMLTSCNDSLSSSFPIYFLLYLIMMTIISSASLYYEIQIYSISSHGTPTTGHEYRNASLSQYIEYKMIYLYTIWNTLLLILGCTIAAVVLHYYYSYNDTQNCSYVVQLPLLWWIIYGILLFIQLIQSVLIITTLVAIKSVPIAVVPSTIIDDEYDERSIDLIINNNNQQQQQQQYYIHNNIHIAEEMWQNRCEGCCRILAISTCYLFGGRGIVTHASAATATTAATERGPNHQHQHNQFYGDIARVLADFFIDFESSAAGMVGVGGIMGGAGLDVVPSDVGLGIAVLKLVQDQRRYMARKDVLVQRQRLQQQQQQQQRLALSSSSSSLSVLSSYREDGTTLLFRRSIDNGEGMIEGDHATTLLSPSAAAVSSSTPPPVVGVDNVEEEVYQSYSRTVLSPYNSEHYTIIEEGAHFAKHQLAIYTWMLYYYQYPISGTIRLIGRKIRSSWFSFKNYSTSSPSSGSTNIENNYEDVDEAIFTGSSYGDGGRQQSEMMMTTVVGDNCLRLHELTLIAQAGIESSDVAYASFNSGGFYETPYCIIIDHKWQSVVLSIRGSLTLEDCIVDVLLDPSPLDELGRVYGFEGTGQYCHGGVLECTHWLHDDLMKHRILSTLLLGDTAKYPNYTLRIVGHSLGAGIGVILSLMLRGTYPTLRCICYSPPGGLLTWELAKQCSTFVNSFILDSDIVPRLSVNNVEYLRDEVLRLIARVKLSKYDIVRRIFWHGLFGSGDDNVDDADGGNANYSVQMTEDMLHPPDCVPESDFSRQLHRFELMQSERRSSRGLARSVSLYPPGRITHLIKISQIKGIRYQVNGCVTCGASNAGSEYTPVLKENDDFNEIEISPTMWTDHFPNRVCFELEKVAKSFGI